MQIKLRRFTAMKISDGGFLLALQCRSTGHNEKQINKTHKRREEN